MKYKLSTSSILEQVDYQLYIKIDGLEYIFNTILQNCIIKNYGEYLKTVSLSEWVQDKDLIKSERQVNEKYYKLPDNDLFDFVCVNKIHDFESISIHSFLNNRFILLDEYSKDLYFIR